jgi:hypothetical protein
MRCTENGQQRKQENGRVSARIAVTDSYTGLGFLRGVG